MRRDWIPIGIPGVPVDGREGGATQETGGMYPLWKEEGARATKMGLVQLRIPGGVEMGGLASSLSDSAFICWENWLCRRACTTKRGYSPRTLLLDRHRVNSYCKPY